MSTDFVAPSHLRVGEGRPGGRQNSRLTPISADVHCRGTVSSGTGMGPGYESPDPPNSTPGSCSPNASQSPTQARTTSS